MQLHSEVLETGTSTYEFGGDIIQPITVNITAYLSNLNVQVENNLQTKVRWNNTVMPTCGILRASSMRKFSNRKSFSNSSVLGDINRKL